MTSVGFRNVDARHSDPVESWPLEALQSAMERGALADYQRIVAAIRAEPWGPVARRVEQVLTWSQPYGVDVIMRRALDRSRERARRSEVATVCATLRDSLDRSGLTQAEFALRLGTSASRLSTYLGGSVVPAATLVERARAVAERAR